MVGVIASEVKSYTCSERDSKHVGYDVRDVLDVLGNMGHNVKCSFGT